MSELRTLAAIICWLMLRIQISRELRFTTNWRPTQLCCHSSSRISWCQGYYYLQLIFSDGSLHSAVSITRQRCCIRRYWWADAPWTVVCRLHQHHNKLLIVTKWWWWWRMLICISHYAKRLYCATCPGASWKGMFSVPIEKIRCWAMGHGDDQAACSRPKYK